MGAVNIDNTASGAAITLTGNSGLLLVDGVGQVGVSASQTLTNKRIDPRVSSTASAASITPDVSSYDQYVVTAQAAGLAINAPTGTPVDGNKLVFRLLDDGTARALTWDGTYDGRVTITLPVDGTYTAIGVTLPTTTTANKTTYVGCIYNANNTRWDVIAVTTEA